MRRFLLSIFFVCFCFFCLGQINKPIIYTINDGLPSNVSYKTIEDKKGFLWIATDQGVVRFDGKNFQLFSKAQGVPDNEVLQIAESRDGIIWIACYNNSIAYYNTIKNRFIDVTSIAALFHLKGEKTLSTPAEGGVQFDTESGSFLFRENRNGSFSLQATFDSTYIIKTNEDGSEYRYAFNPKNNKDSSVYIYYVKDNNIMSKHKLGYLGKYLHFSTEESILHIFTDKKDFITVSDFEPSLKNLDIQKHALRNNYYMHNFTSRYLNIMHRTKDLNNGKDIMEVNVYDKKSFAYLFTINENVLAFSLLNDQDGNLWMSTMHSGLYKYPSSPTVKPCLSEAYKNVNFYSVACDHQNTLYAGNEKGEIIEWNNNVQKTHKVFTSNKIEWQRKIIKSQDKIFTFSDGGVFVNYNKEVHLNESNEHIRFKAAEHFGDTSILIGTNNGLYQLNTITQKITSFPIKQKSILSLTHINQQLIYIGTTEGLDYYDLRNLSYHQLKTNSVLSDRIVSMCVTNDQLLWVATATNGIVVLKDNHIIKQISETNGLASNNALSIVSGKNGEVWLGTNTGVSRIFYTFNHDGIRNRIQNISTIDGLSTPIVNQLCYHNRVVYAATQKGVCIIPDSIPIPSINVELTNLKINQKDTLLLSRYKLRSNEKDIAMQFSSANLIGYFKHLDYSRDEGKTWVSLDENKLRIDFDNGVHSIWLRAVDVNKNIGEQILKLSFDIAIPFWKKWWFWVGITLLIQIGLGYGFYKRQQRKELEKRKLELAKANLASLEQQAFTSLMNPHFMFNALNSIQHYINHQDRQNANRYLSDFASLIRKNFEAAQQAFIPLEQEMENISLYLRLEKMRFNDKFNFEIVYDEDIDPEEWMMPTMILQPLVENSILHGVMPSQIPGKLTLQLSDHDGNLLLEVIDNGIGVENSRALKQGSKHRSRGMELIYKRLKALSFFSKHELQLEYSVPFIDERNPGNKTSLVIPFDLYQAWRKTSHQPVS